MSRKSRKRARKAQQQRESTKPKPQKFWEPHRPIDHGRDAPVVHHRSTDTLAKPKKQGASQLFKPHKKDDWGIDWLESKSARRIDWDVEDAMKAYDEADQHFRDMFEAEGMLDSLSDEQTEWVVSLLSARDDQALARAEVEKANTAKQRIEPFGDVSPSDTLDEFMHLGACLHLILRHDPTMETNRDLLAAALDSVHYINPRSWKRLAQAGVL